MNKRLWIWFLVFMLLSGGCQVREDAAGYGADIKKAQEIAVIPFGETQETKVLTEEAEIEAFAQGLELETWVWKPLPDQAATLGTFCFSQAETQNFGSPPRRSCARWGVLTLYAGGYVRLTLHDLTLDFAIGEDAGSAFGGIFGLTPSFLRLCASQLRGWEGINRPGLRALNGTPYQPIV